MIDELGDRMRNYENKTRIFLDINLPNKQEVVNYLI